MLKEGSFHHWVILIPGVRVKFIFFFEHEGNLRENEKNTVSGVTVQTRGGGQSTVRPQRSSTGKFSPTNRETARQGKVKKKENVEENE